MWNAKFSDCLLASVVEDCWASAKVFQENSIYIILYQLTKHQDKNFTFLGRERKNPFLPLFWRWELKCF